jgi:ferredoxin
MAKRTIIEIDEDKCTGCGACVTKCAEGALKIVDGKAKVVSDVFCDGFGVCIGECPEGALRIVEREAPGFDPGATEEHLSRLKKMSEKKPIGDEPCGCQSSNPMILTASSAKPGHGHSEARDDLPPKLTNWPVQWRLVTPAMPFFKDKDVLLSADCVPFAFRDFHGKFLTGKPVIIGCPKLDEQTAYLEKLTDILRDATPRSLDIVIMEVPCCFGLKKLVDEAVRRSGKSVPVRTTAAGIKGNIVRKE